ncbi:MAG TPA: GDSL-type esterase/lipase family protein [Ktedonobacterales bacterium]|nr:GDSL-type esterase/lipase family protein [Ktedonobacterales bacterium]
MGAARGRREWRGWRGWSAGVLATLAVALVLAGCGGSATGATAPRATRTPTPLPTVRYVALGASDAVGYGADHPNTEGYVPLLIARLPHGASALNLGILGNTVHPALKNELPYALAAKPTLVTIWLVGNDFRNCVALADYQADLTTLLTTLHAQTSAHVFIANLPDLTALPVFQNGAAQAGACWQGMSASQLRAAVIQWNAAIAAIAASQGAVLVDLYHSDLAAHPEYIFRDGFHPSTAGYADLANIFWEQIQAHGGAPAA